MPLSEKRKKLTTRRKPMVIHD